MAAESESDDEEQAIYNPLKLPMGWDGKPIPYWLYKLHGLGQVLVNPQALVPSITKAVTVCKSQKRSADTRRKENVSKILREQIPGRSQTERLTLVQ